MIAVKTKGLFLCTGNSFRSQMTEGWTRAMWGDWIDAYSAGDEIRQGVRRRYAGIARAGGTCCASSNCCSADAPGKPDSSTLVGYSEDDLSAVPDGANLGLGCGNPQAIAALKPGETVLDLGSGGGFDCFLAARQVGDMGRVIGVDTTPEMVSKARANAVKGGCGPSGCR